MYNDETVVLQLLSAIGAQIVWCLTTDYQAGVLQLLSAICALIVWCPTTDLQAVVLQLLKRYRRANKSGVLQQTYKRLSYNCQSAIGAQKSLVSYNRLFTVVLQLLSAISAQNSLVSYNRLLSRCPTTAIALSAICTSSDGSTLPHDSHSS